MASLMGFCSEVESSWLSLNVKKLRRRTRKCKPALVDADLLFSPVLIKNKKKKKQKT